MKKLLRLIAVAVLGLGVTVGGVAAADSATVDTTGPDSTVTIDFAEDYDATVDNTATVALDFTNDQTTDTGSARVNRNTGGGSATTGAAHAENEVKVTGTIDNTKANSMLGGSSSSTNTAKVMNTGPGSDVDVNFNNTKTLSLTNTTDLAVTNNNTQNTTSGDASVTNNTEGGSAKSGNSTATSSSSFNFTVKN